MMNKQNLIDGLELVGLEQDVIKDFVEDETGAVSKANMEFCCDTQGPDTVVPSDCEFAGSGAFFGEVWYDAEFGWSGDASYKFNSGQSHGSAAANPDTTPHYDSLAEAVAGAQTEAEDFAESLNLRAQDTDGRKGTEFVWNDITFIFKRDAEWATKKSRAN
ncbi:MAG: hypothetical protein ACYDEV_04395 [Acidiferrobacter sp.]